jgi:hypothetical protein
MSKGKKKMEIYGSGIQEGSSMKGVLERAEASYTRHLVLIAGGLSGGEVVAYIRNHNTSGMHLSLMIIIRICGQRRISLEPITV